MNNVGKTLLIWLSVVISKSQAQPRHATLPNIWTEPRAGLSGVPHESGSEQSSGRLDYLINNQNNQSF